MDTRIAKFPKLSQRGKDLRSVISLLKGGSALLLVVAVCSLPTPCHAVLTPASATGNGPFSTDTATLTPNTVNMGNDTPNYFTGQCPWITSTMNNFVSSNSATYTYQWATPTFNLQADLSVSDYYAWVNTSTNNTASNFPGTPHFQSNLTNGNGGGCVFTLNYTPTAAGSPTNVFIIQSFTDNLNGGSTNLDNSGATPWYGGASLGPAYGNGGTVTSLADMPYDSITNAMQLPYGDNVQFQDAIAVDNVVGGTNNLTLYQGEEWWGFQISMTAIPEPTTSVLVLASLVLLGARGIRRRASK